MQNNDDDEVTMSFDEFGNKIYRNKAGKLHRLDGPAIESADGDSRLWYASGKPHRIGGPAFEIDNRAGWFLYGEGFDTIEEYFEALSDEQKLIALMSPKFYEFYSK